MSVLDRLSDSRVGRYIKNEGNNEGCYTSSAAVPGCAVAVVVTESCASVLGAGQELRHLQDVGENWCKSLVSLPRAFSAHASGTAQLLVIYGRRPNMVMPTSKNLLTTPPSLFVLFKSMEDTSTESINTGEEEVKEENISRILEETPAWCEGPVLQVRSIAHDDRLVLSERGSRLLVRVVDDAASNCTDSGWHNFCRICHGGESIEQLVAPCRCRGSVALAHLTCLERWLKESGSDTCELCNQRYQVVRRPRYPLLKSIFVWATDSAARGPHLLEDFAAFCLYTPSALTATYALMVRIAVSVCLCVKLSSPSVILGAV